MRKTFPSLPAVSASLTETRKKFGVFPGYELTQADYERASRFDVDEQIKRAQDERFDLEEFIKHANDLHDYVKIHGPIKF